MLDIAIIGAGPAGITAAVYAKRYNLDLMVFERNYVTGGKILYPHWIENYIGFPEGISGSGLAELFSNHLTKMDIKVEKNNIISIKKVENGFEIIDQKNQTYLSKTVILTQGTEERMLGIPGESKYKGLGVSYCATCDAPFFKGKTIATIGGGDSALSEALYLSEFADHLYLIHRREEIRGADFFAEKIKSNPKIKTYFGCVATQIIGDQYVNQIEIEQIANHEKVLLKVDGVFIFAGYEPCTNFVKEDIRLDSSGFIITDELMETNIKGLFAAGDIRKKSLRQIITAVSDGSIAAHSIREYLKG